MITVKKTINNFVSSSIMFYLNLSSLYRIIGITAKILDWITCVIPTILTWSVGFTTIILDQIIVITAKILNWLMGVINTILDVIMGATATLLIWIMGVTATILNQIMCLIATVYQLYDDGNHRPNGTKNSGLAALVSGAIRLQLLLYLNF